MPTPHPHARHVRRARKYPLHVRYNPRTDIPVYAPTYPPPPLPYPGGGDQTTPVAVEINELTEFEGLPSGFTYLMAQDGTTYLTTPDTIYLIGTV